MHREKAELLEQRLHQKDSTQVAELESVRRENARILEQQIQNERLLREIDSRETQRDLLYREIQRQLVSKEEVKVVTKEVVQEQKVLYSVDIQTEEQVREMERLKLSGMAQTDPEEKQRKPLTGEY